MVLLGIAAAFAYVLARYLGWESARRVCVAAGFLMPPASG
jgi:hypothetical protein